MSWVSISCLRPGGGGRALEADVDVGRFVLVGPGGENVVSLGFSAGFIENALGERTGGVDLKVQARGGVKKLHQQQGGGAVGGDVRFAQDVHGIGGDEVGETVNVPALSPRAEDERWRRLRQAVFASGVVGPSDRADPVFGKVGIGGFGLGPQSRRGCGRRDRSARPGWRVNRKRKWWRALGMGDGLAGDAGRRGGWTSNRTGAGGQRRERRDDHEEGLSVGSGALAGVRR